MKIRFWVEQWMHALFEWTEDVNEISKNHIKAVLWWILRDFFVLAKMILGVKWRFDSWRLKLA